MALAILDEDQRQLDSAVAARVSYSAAGYRIITRGYGAYLQAWSDSVNVHLPPVETC